MEEIWKPVVGFEGLYKVSNLGVVKGIKYSNVNHIKGNISKGYNVLILYKNGTPYSFSRHRLVAEAFIPNPNNYPIVMHLDNNRLNNLVTNLKWGTHKENTQQMYREGRDNNIFKRLIHPKYMTGKLGKLHPNSKVINQYTLDGVFIRKWDSASDASRELGIGKTSITNSIKKLNKYGGGKTSGGYKWRYDSDNIELLALSSNMDLGEEVDIETIL